MSSADRALQLLNVVAAALGLIVTAPVIALSAIGIKLTTGGPILYRAPRVGQAGEQFTMLKLRTMHVGRERDGRVTSGIDVRVFPVGRVLRRFKLDELPQLVNVLRGEMALVGPRPEDVTIVRERYDPMMMRTLAVPPGLTSVGTLHYYAEESALPEDPAEAEALYLEELLPRKVALDLVYVDHRSLSYALEVLVRTGLGIVGWHRLFARKMRWERETAEAYLRQARSG